MAPQVDPFVGVLYRQSFIEKLRSMLPGIKRNALVFCIDIDHLSKINARFGMSVGDQVIEDLSSRLSSVSNSLLLGRISGDQFALVVSVSDTVLSDKRGLRKASASIVSAIATPKVPDRTIDVDYHCSVGCYPLTGESIDVDQILARAESAMLRSKRDYHHSICFYDPEIDSVDSLSFGLYTELWQALRKQEFEVFYQPRVNIRTGGIVGAEALIRWRNPDSILIPPGEFIPALEQTGLIIPVGYWVVSQVLRDIPKMREKGILGRISINLSLAQFHDRNLLSKMKEIILGSGIDPESIEFELTETQIFANERSVIDFISELSQLGVSFALDDFGTGYSSFSMLQQMPVSVIKIDRSFTSNLIESADSRVIVDTLIAMSLTMKKEIVAEGVETLAQAEYLLSQGCRLAQGFLYSPPVPFATLLESASEESCLKCG
jgi:diguanylate cyclase (GGDEF)-like protein